MWPSFRAHECVGCPRQCLIQRTTTNCVALTHGASSLLWKLALPGDQQPDLEAECGQESLPRARDHTQGCTYRVTTSSVHPGTPGSVTRARRVPTEGAKFPPREGSPSLLEGQKATHLLPGRRGTA